MLVRSLISIDGENSLSKVYEELVEESMANDLDERIRYQLCQTNELHNGQTKEFEVRTAGVQANVLLIRQNEQFYAYANKCCHYKLSLVKGMKKERFSSLFDVPFVIG